MPHSQNALFSGEESLDLECDEPPGFATARLLKSLLAERGWQVAEIDLWRDGGWSVSCSRASARLDVVILKLTTGADWTLQIAPTDRPGLIGWLLKKSASATPDEIHTLAQETFAILGRAGFRDFRWCWDDFPEEGHTTPAPTPPERRDSKPRAD